MECKKEENLVQCPCSYISKRTGTYCERKGVCCECIRHHLLESTLPACYVVITEEKR